MKNRRIFLPNSIFFDTVKSGRLFALAENEYGINQRIVQIRKTVGYSQEKFAEGIKVSRSFQGGIEANHRKVNDRLVKMICMAYGVSENWLKTGAGEMFDTAKDPRLERIIRNFNKLDQLLQDYVMKYLDWLVEYYAKKPK
jgi:transcriptional regulator with XRE-family HTH domain